MPKNLTTSGIIIKPGISIVQVEIEGLKKKPLDDFKTTDILTLFDGLEYTNLKLYKLIDAVVYHLEYGGEEKYLKDLIAEFREEKIGCEAMTGMIEFDNINIVCPDCKENFEFIDHGNDLVLINKCACLTGRDKVMDLNDLNKGR